MGSHGSQQPGQEREKGGRSGLWVCEKNGDNLMCVYMCERETKGECVYTKLCILLHDSRHLPLSDILQTNPGYTGKDRTSRL